MTIPTVYIVGADKGGVGKTTVTRLLLDYFKATGVNYKAFDTEYPSGGLQRFYPEQTEIIDITKTSDMIKVFDNLSVAQAFVIDVRAGLLSPTIKKLTDIGLLEAVKSNKLRLVVLHVLGPATQSLEEVKPMVASLTGARHIAVANHINHTEYAAPAGALQIAMLDPDAAKAVDAVALPFSEFVGSQGSFVLRGLTRNWVAEAFAQFNGAKLNDASLI